MAIQKLHLTFWIEKFLQIILEMWKTRKFTWEAMLLKHLFVSMIGISETKTPQCSFKCELDKVDWLRPLPIAKESLFFV